MLCTNCGKQIPDNVQICPECGAEYYFPTVYAAPSEPVYRPTEPMAQPEPLKKHTGLVITIAVIVSLMIVAVNAFIGMTAFHMSNILLDFPEPDIHGSTPSTSSGQDFTQQEAEYATALALMENRRYEEALVAFRALGDYRDSRAKANDCAYAAALQCLDSDDLRAAMDFVKYMNKSQSAQFYERYYVLMEGYATNLIQESLKTNFYDLLHSTGELPYDPMLESHYLELYNNTIYRYTLSYRIHYYDRDGNIIRQSQTLTAEIFGANYIRVPVPIDNSFEWARYDVEYRIRDVDYRLSESPKYAVRVLDDQGAPIDNALISLHDGGRVRMATTDRHGLISLLADKQEPTFQASVSHYPGYNHLEQTYEFLSDGLVHDLVVLRDTPDFSVNVMDANGAPIPGVTLYLTTTDVFTASKYEKTDENGYACWYDVDMSHSYKITDLRKTGYVSISEIHFKDTNHITVLMQREKPKNDTPSFTVSVVDTDGNPISGVVMYLAYSDVIGGDWYERTDKNGWACWYDMDMSHSYKVIRISKEGYICPEEVHFVPGENHLTIVLEEDESEA